MKVNCQVRYASNPVDAKNYDTARLRKEFLFENVMVKDEVNMVYSMFDRIIAGGAVPVDEKLVLTPPDILKADHFTSRREVGVINVGGEGIVRVAGNEYKLERKEALYIGRGEHDIEFASRDPKHPAHFYFNSAPAHCSYPDKLVTKKDAVVMNCGSLEESNQRTINRLLVKEVIQCCQLQMGMTELKPGSTWNTMPAHTHDRRMEVYFYFDLPEEGAVCHFMGEPQETRHIWMHDEQAVISPQWSIHSACATSNYTFIWGMCGENQDYNDMDWCKTTDLR
ncbi:MAG: 5-dehydro-4-deoxy-D-glucuronate isomerase [Bacteroidales bacterium]|jgi:4-deoxy-L-threo-5-hexosulose-uronate ketol-isomerase|nr:5-dehydro-4-deoxy-D-glucuronate isomerase [Bacteroidales bacterium]MCI2122313.1 5-dehydro-4-deoxy-D-glucuronate isomerase [Bacteroidales bacterium]